MEPIRDPIACICTQEEFLAIFNVSGQGRTEFNYTRSGLMFADKTNRLKDESLITGK